MQTSPEQFHTLLQQQISGAEELLETMQLENDALVKRDLEALQESAAHKSELSKTLEALGNKQKAFLEAHGQNNSPDGMDAYLASLPKAAHLALEQKKEQLLELLEKCQIQNLINGNIIAASKQSAETALSILRGQSPSENVMYTSGGQAVSDTSRDPLTKA